jgi:hypothetical protein
MPNLEGLVRIVKELRVERTNLVNELKHLDAALAVLGKLNGGSSYTKPRRSRISLAQKTRWQNTGANNQPRVKARRTMSASARRKIAVAQRARWAKVRALQGKKTAKKRV